MELTVERTTKTSKSTIGNFMVDGNFQCYCLEPTDRGLTSDMSPDQIKAIKIAAETAIPTGRYKVIEYISPDHKNALVPLLVAVPGFEYVEIHVGNYPANTKACILLGTQKGPDEVLHSVDAINAFYPKFKTAIANKEEVWITVKEADEAAGSAA